MERGETPKILRLAPNSLFISFPSFFSIYFSALFFALSFVALKLQCGWTTHSRCTNLQVCAIIIHEGFLYRSLLQSIFEHKTHRICVLFPCVPFLRHYMHRYDLSFDQAGLPRSCAYALHSRQFSQGIKGAPLRLLLPGHPDVYLRLGEAESQRS